MAYIQHNNPFKITSCGRRRTFMQSGSPGKDRTEGNPFGIDKTEAEKKTVLKRNETPHKKLRKTTVGEGRHFRKPEEGAGMTEKGVKAYKKENPGSKLKTAVTGKVKPGSKAAKRRKSFCAR